MVVSFERNCGAASVWGWWLYYRIILVLSLGHWFTLLRCYIYFINSVDKTNEANYLVSMAVWLWLTVLRSNIYFGVMSKVKKNVNFLSLSFFFLFFSFFHFCVHIFDSCFVCLRRNEQSYLPQRTINGNKLDFIAVEAKITPTWEEVKTVEAIKMEPIYRDFATQRNSLVLGS